MHVRLLYANKVQFNAYHKCQTQLSLNVNRIRQRPTQSIRVWLSGLRLYLRSDRDKTLQRLYHSSGVLHAQVYEFVCHFSDKSARVDGHCRQRSVTDYPRLYPVSDMTFDGDLRRTESHRRPKVERHS